MKTVYHVTRSYAFNTSTLAIVESVEIALEKILAEGISEFTFFDHEKPYEVYRSEMTESAWDAALALARANFSDICFFGKGDNGTWCTYSIVKYHE